MSNDANFEEILKSREKKLLYRKEFGNFEINSLQYRDNYFSVFRAVAKDDSKDQYDIAVLDAKYNYNRDVIKQLQLKIETLAWIKEKYPDSKIPEKLELKEIKIDGEPFYYYYRPKVDGATLSEILKKYSKLSPADAFDLVKHLRSTIEHSYNERLWMHIFDPMNFVIYTDDNNQPNLLISDIGVNYKFITNEDIAENIKYFYAPEQISSDESGLESDIYALGALVYFMISGDMPIYDEAKGMHPFFEKALNPDKNQRHHSFEDFYMELEAFSSNYQRGINWPTAVFEATSYRKSDYSFDREGYEEESGYGKTGSPLEKVAVNVTMQVKDELKRKARLAFFGAVTAVIAVGLAKLWDWWYKPKKVLATAGIAIIGLAVAGYYTMTNKSGEIAISVREAYGNIPFKRLDSVKVVIEAVQNKADDPMPDIEFFSSDPAQAPERMSITLWTNEDGIAFVKYKGRFDRDQVVINVKINTEGTKHQMAYNNAFNSDTVLGEKELITVIAIPKRDMVTDTINIALPPIPAGVLAVYETPPKEYKVDIKVMDIKDKPSTNAYFTIYDGKSDKNGKKLLLEGETFTAKDLQFRTEPYILIYTVEDSSKVYYDFTITNPEDFPFDFEAPPAQEISKKAKEGGGGGGGASSLAIAPVFERKDSASFQYTFEIIDQSGNKLKGAYIYIVPSNDIENEEAHKYQLGADGTIKFPEQPFRNLYDFWNQNGSEMELTIKLYFPRNPPGKRFSKPRNFPKKFIEQEIIKIKYDQDRNVILF